MFYNQRAIEKSIILNDLNLKNNSFVLATIHRAENTDDLKRLKSIVEAINEINKTYKVVLPVHPRTRAIFEKNNIKTEFVSIDPVGYFDMIQLMSNCSLICTDSGGLQKEAYFFNKYCITFRDQTEWVELVENGYNIITSADKELMMDAFGFFKDKPFHKATELYGGGNAAKTMTDFLINQKIK
jgi:UDP-GlcNAc3NAcA epimerase